MTDITTLIGRLLPFAVIAGLALVFYSLDVFSVRPGFDAEPAKVAAREAPPRMADVIPPRRSDSALVQPNISSPMPASANLPPPQGVPAPGDANYNVPIESEMPPQDEAAPPAASMGQQDGMQSPVPRYVAPVGGHGQPLATDMNRMDASQLPSNEIAEDPGENINNETLQAVEETEQGASLPGANEQQQ